MCALAACNAAASPKMRLCHIANAGFFIHAGDKSVLVDAVLGEPYPPYQQPSEPLNTAIESSTGPFGNVDLVLTTHHHGDHFDAAATLRHLRANESAGYVVTRQALSQMEESGLTQAESERILAVYPPAGQPLETEINGISLTVWRVSHGTSSPVENLGFRFELGGKSVFHPGDMFMAPRELPEYGLDRIETDYLLAPMWLLTDSDQLDALHAAFDPGIVVPMHMIDEEAAQGQQWVAELGGWTAIRKRYLSAVPDTVDLLGEMDCIALAGE